MAVWRNQPPALLCSLFNEILLLLKIKGVVSRKLGFVASLKDGKFQTQNVVLIYGWEFYWRVYKNALIYASFFFFLSFIFIF